MPGGVMPRRADVPCAGGCGKVTWSGPGSLPPGQATCQECRRARREQQTPWTPATLSCRQCGRTFQQIQPTQCYCSAICRGSRSRGGWRPNSQVRGYGKEHVAERKRWVPIVKAGGVACAKCGLPLIPGRPWDLGHTADRTGWTGPEHPHCNRRDGAKRGNKMRATRGDRTVWHKPCVQCGQAFSTIFKRQLTCSKACAQARRKARPIKPVVGQPMSALICAVCGALFTSSRSNQKLCGSTTCRKTYNNEWVKSYYHANPDYRASVIERAKADYHARKSREW